MRKGETTRRQIIRSSAELMNRHGWLATPVSAITSAAGITKGGLYNHFDSLHELSLASFDYAGEKLLALVESKLAITGTASQRLQHLIDGFDIVGGRKGPFHGGCPLLNAAIESDDNDEALRLRAVRLSEAIIDRLAAIITAGTEQGEFHPALDARRASRSLLAAFEGGVMLAGLHRDRTVMEDVKQGLTAMIACWKNEEKRV